MKVHCTIFWFATLSLAACHQTTDKSSVAAEHQSASVNILLAPLSRMFKQQVGYSPNEYRQLN